MVLLCKSTGSCGICSFASLAALCLVGVELCQKQSVILDFDHAALIHRHLYRILLSGKRTFSDRRTTSDQWEGTSQCRSDCSWCICHQQYQLCYAKHPVFQCYQFDSICPYTGRFWWTCYAFLHAGKKRRTPNAQRKSGHEHPAAASV